MAQIIPFKKPDDDRVTLFDWVREHYSDEEKRLRLNTFMIMDIV